MNDAIMSLTNLSVRFPGGVHAVEDVTLDVRRGETLGIVGESGCGKSTLIRAILRLGPAALHTVTGEILFGGQNLRTIDKEALRELRRKMQIIHQDPYTSLNPSMTVERIIAEPLFNFGWNKKDARARVRELLKMVGLSPDHARRYPHEFSGGQRQRIGIARAIALDPVPELIVADEPTSALDVSVRAQIINLLEQLKQELGLTLIFVSHDLATVRHVSDRIAVMYLGRIVELGSANDVVERPMHPYAEALLSCIPVPDPDAVRNAIELVGEVPSPKNPPSGCAFRTRCPFATEACAVNVPQLRMFDGRQVACDRLEEIR